MKNVIDQNSEFSNMVDARLSRRSFLLGSATVGAGTFLALNPIANAIASRHG
ncbi:twin-arginine translocation signal domain-containing protein [Psychromonas sp. KJ10-10]|uniref:twin-arginine translocation signal domain-containing protein n=1 Tax=Psychromonas sp. KJ10-10 TaxID=3391823 RepID=UPI0039B3976C